MISISFSQIIETERNIRRKIREICYKKYGLNVCSGNIGITICTTATLIILLDEFFGHCKKYTCKRTPTVSCKLFLIIIYETIEHFTNFDICHIVRR